MADGQGAAAHRKQIEACGHHAEGDRADDAPPEDRRAGPRVDTEFNQVCHTRHDQCRGPRGAAFGVESRKVLGE